MRAASVLAGLWLFVGACNACADSPKPPLSPDGLANALPGYYPGRASVVRADQAEAWSLFLVNNRGFIREVEQGRDLIRSDASVGGCLQKSLAICMASLSQTMVVATAFSADPDDQDLSHPKDWVSLADDGLPADPLARIIIFGPGLPRTLAVTPVLSDDEVFSFAIDLPVDPIKALATGELAQTRLYELTTAVLGGRCPLGDATHFYRSLRAWKLSTREDNPSGKHFRTRAAESNLCGAKISIATTIDVDGREAPAYSLFVGSP